jgi:hypothetical protein
VGLGFLVRLFRCSVSLFGVTVRGFRMLVSGLMITFLVMLGGSPVCLGSVIVVFRCFVMGVLRHNFYFSSWARKFRARNMSLTHWAAAKNAV